MLSFANASSPASLLYFLPFHTANNVKNITTDIIVMPGFKTLLYSSQKVFLWLITFALFGISDKSSPASLITFSSMQKIFGLSIIVLNFSGGVPFIIFIAICAAISPDISIETTLPPIIPSPRPPSTILNTGTFALLHINFIASVFLYFLPSASSVITTNINTESSLTDANLFFSSKEPSCEVLMSEKSRPGYWSLYL